MKHSDFVHLHVHTQYSLLDGANRLDYLFKKASDFKMDALAITDHGNLFGVIDFYSMAQERGIAPIIGCEVYVAAGSRLDREKGVESFEGTNHLILIAMNDDGYKNLIKLSTLAHLEGFYYKPRVDKEILSKYNSGLIATSACLNGVLSRSILDGEISKARALAGEYAEIFKDRFYLELQRNGLPDQDRLNAGLLEIKKSLGLPLVATNDCHYLLKEHAPAHDVLLCIQTRKTRQDQDRLRFATEELYFKSPQEMEALFAELPEAVRHTREIAERCTLKLRFGEFNIPKFPLPGSETVDSYLEKLAQSGLEERMKAILSRNPKEPEKVEGLYRCRLREELDTIKSMGFSGYFLIVADVIGHARSRGIPVGPGRGSAAGSLTAYALRITNIDPIPHSLLFERFLNPHRKTLPDIDVDFCEERRGEVFRYVVDKYGSERVAHITTFGTLKPRAVVKDVGRAMGLPYGDVDRITKLIPMGAKDIEEALRNEPRLKEIQEKEAKIAELLATASSLQGLYRHSSTHAAGVVFSDSPLTEHLPLCQDKDGQTVTQYDMKAIEKIGLVKFDFLGLKTLTLIERAKHLIEKRRGIRVNMDEIPHDDPAIYTLLCSGETMGVFQLEGQGMTNVVVSLKPERFDELVALVALYRPGPMMMIEDFIKRKQGKVPVEYEFPALEEILKDTYGVMIYQEQVMQIFNKIGGFSLAEADTIRSAIGKKKKHIMKKSEDKFLQGAVKRGIPMAAARRVFEQMESFGEYGFNKSHSVAYATVAFQTAYLKANYPEEFMAALLSSEIGDTDKVKSYISECRRMGINVLPPDINESDKDFTVVADKTIRFGLGAVKNVGGSAVDAVISTRKGGGPFASIFDFCARVEMRKVNRRALESFVRCGVFDSTGARRSQLMAVLNEAMEMGHDKQKERAEGQLNIFQASGPSAIAHELPDIEEWSEEQILKFEKDTIGTYVTGHPLRQYTDEIGKYITADSSSLHELPDGEEACIGGLPAALKEITNRKGERMGFLTLEDLKGSVEVVVFADIFRKSSHCLRIDAPIIVRGRTNRGEDKSKLLAMDIVPLSEARYKLARCVHIKISDSPSFQDNLEKLREIILTHRGKSKTILHLIVPKRSETIVSLPDDYCLDPSDVLVKKVEDLLGPGVIEF